MKNKFMFLMPRIIGVTLIIGLASLLLGLVFKLLIGLIVIGSIAFVGATIIKKIKHGRDRHSITSFPGRNNNFQTTKHNKTIVPIN